MSMSLGTGLRRSSKNVSSFDLDAELRNNSWCPFLGLEEAEELLKDQPAYTFLLRPKEAGRGFAISFMNPKGVIEHHPFTLINAKYGIFRNFCRSNVGRLSQVVCYMMECTSEQMRPLR